MVFYFIKKQQNHKKGRRKVMKSKMALMFFIIAIMTTLFHMNDFGKWFDTENKNAFYINYNISFASGAVEKIGSRRL